MSNPIPDRAAKEAEFVSSIKNIQKELDSILRKAEAGLLDVSDGRSYMVFMCGLPDKTKPINNNEALFYYFHDIAYPDDKKDLLFFQEHIEESLIPIITD